jgi:hypothetical protein
LERIEQEAFERSGLESIVIPSSVVVLGGGAFSQCMSHQSVEFERGCRLELIDEFAFYRSGLKSIVIPSSVVVLGKQCFVWCKALELVTFEGGSGLKCIDKSMFSHTRVDFPLVADSLAGTRGISAIDKEILRR